MTITQKRAVILLVIAMLGLARSAARADLVAHWTFDDGALDNTSTTAFNSGTLGATAEGTLTHQVPVTGDWVTDDVAPVFGSSAASLYFDGTNDYVEALGWKGIGDADARTMTAWIKTTGTDMTILSWGENATAQKWIFRTTSGGRLRIEVAGDGIEGTTSVTDGRWHHVAASFVDDGTPTLDDITFYVDGALDPIAAPKTHAVNTDVVAGENVRIGQDHHDRLMSGLMDDVRVYDEALSTGQIADLVGPVFGDLLVFDFTGPSNGSIPLTATSTRDPGVVLTSGLDLGPGTATSTSNPQTNEWDIMGFVPAPATLDDAIAAEDYLTFTVEPGAGYTLNLSGIRFDLWRNGTGAPAEYAIFSSLDGFDSASDALATFSVPGSGSISEQVSLNAQVVRFGIDGPVEFRIYGWGGTSDSGNTHFIGAALMGWVTVPEPATGVLALVGFLGVALIRRRRVRRA